MFFFTNNNETQHSYLVDMNETRVDSIHHVKYKDMRNHIFLAFRNLEGKARDALAANWEELPRFLNVSAIQHDEEFIEDGRTVIHETIFKMH